MIAIPAPSILGQFNTSIEAVYGALRQMGFADVVEVAQGAMDTVSHEAAELKEKLEEGQPFMTTSCCPSYIELVNKHIPGMKPYVSSTGSPMYYAARIAKERHPDAKIVFIGRVWPNVKKPAAMNVWTTYLLLRKWLRSLRDWTSNLNRHSHSQYSILRYARHTVLLRQVV